jgi:16S rRNA (uracil1498-N3)-methyltransferase
MVGGVGGAAVITLLMPPGMAPGRREPVDEAEGHHLRVRRAAAGERVALRDGAGLVGTGRLTSDGREWVVDVEAVERRARPAELTLAIGAGDRDRFAWLVEKAVELGATTVVPLETDRTSGVATRVRDAHLPKLRRQALEAIKQCGAAWALEVDEPQSLAAFIARTEPGIHWLADASGAVPPGTLDGSPVTVVIGPEGGLTEPERGLLLSAGYRPLALAPHTLRFETAALAAAAVVTTARLRGLHG